MPKCSVRGVSLHWEVVGQGEPVALLNGVLMTTQSWKLQTSVLRRHYRCLMHDFRGQLLSDKPDREWTLDDHARDLHDLLDHHGVERCHLVGTSYGGEVGMIFAAEWPERVKSLSVISSVSEVDHEMAASVASWRTAALDAPETLYRVSLPFNYSRRFIADNPTLVSLGEERLASLPPEFFTGFGRLIDAFSELDITDRLERIRCPTLVVVGEKDALKPPHHSRRIAERIPDAEFLMIPEAGHAVIIERPDEINAALLEFLAKHAATAA